MKDLNVFIFNTVLPDHKTKINRRLNSGPFLCSLLKVALAIEIKFNKKKIDLTHNFMSLRLPEVNISDSL